MKSLADRLASNEAAIEKAERSQAYTIRGRELQRAQLKTLYDENWRLRAAISAESGGAMSSVVQVSNPGTIP